MPVDTIVPQAVADHYRFLAALHHRLNPVAYLETGVRNGATLALAKCRAIGVEENARLTHALQPNMQVFPQSSDDFFAQHDVLALTGGRPIDLALIDGLHLFETALKDFINVEKCSHAGTVVCIHDVVPQTVRQAAREPQPDGWTGDVFGLILALREYRADLFVTTLDVPFTGMLVVSNLDPSNTVLSDRFDAIVAQHLAMDYARMHEMRHAIFEIAPYSSGLIEFLGANMDASRARRRMLQAAKIIQGDRRVRLGAIV